MSGPAESIQKEIRLLRKGSGINAADLDQRLGPHLRALAAGSRGSGPATVKDTLTAVLIGCAARLAPDVRTAVTVGLALPGPAGRLPLFTDRVGWLAAELGRDNRTALRRIDDAELLLADEIAGELDRRRGRSVPVGWYLEELRTLLRLDTPTPESHEHRRIVATRDGISEVVAWLDVPRETADRPSGLSVEVAHGGRLVRAEQPGRDRFHVMVRLPAPLRTGERHEYGLVLRMPPGQAMRPHYIFTPECRCIDFDLRVRFPPDRLPRWIRRVQHETVRMFDGVQSGRDLIDLDPAGEATVHFRNPTMYLGYGLQWGQ